MFSISGCSATACSKSSYRAGIWCAREDNEGVTFAWAQVVVLPDSGGLVLALVAHARFLVGLLVVEKEQMGAAAVRSARGAAGGLVKGPAEEAPGMPLVPLDMGQFFTVRGPRGRWGGQEARSSCLWPPCRMKDMATEDPHSNAPLHSAR